jgi:TonB family protein
MFIALAAAAGPVALTIPGGPTPIAVGTWFTADDYPVEARKAGAEGMVRFEVDVDATGKPTACRIVKSSGSAPLDEATCKIVMANAHFTPGMLKGKAVAGTYSNNTVWKLEGGGVPMNGYFATIVDFSKDAQHPQCTIMQKGAVNPPTCDQVLSHYGSYGTTQKLTKFVTLVSVTMGAEEPYRGEPDWGRRISFTALDLYKTKDGKQSCVVVASEGDEADPAPCASFHATSVLSDEEKKATPKQHLERSAFAILERSASQGSCKTGESKAETHGCS